MVKLFEHKTREDGVKLVRRLDVQVDENGNPLFHEKEVVDENGNLTKVKEPVPTGFKIHKIGTDEIYDDAIDVEGAPYAYEPTDIPIISETEQNPNELQEGDPYG
jgi:hypothetical protein